MRNLDDYDVMDPRQIIYKSKMLTSSYEYYDIL